MYEYPRGATFQSTFPRRERHNIKLSSYLLDCFNPRSREGNDIPVEGGFKVVKYVSIHVPAKGTTNLPAVFMAYFCVSIHVPAKGTTESRRRWKRHTRVSIHVPAKGTTLCRRNISFSALFQSTFPRRERHYTFTVRNGAKGVSIHVPAKGTTPTHYKIYNALSVSIHVPAKGTTIS